jgi:hypothetical protein
VSGRECLAVHALLPAHLSAAHAHAIFPCVGCRLDADESVILSGQMDGNLQLWDTPTGSSLGGLPVPDGEAGWVTLRSHDTAGSVQARARPLPAALGCRRAAVPGFALQLLNGGRQAVSAHLSGHLQLWDLRAPCTVAAAAGGEGFQAGTLATTLHVTGAPGMQRRAKCIHQAILIPMEHCQGCSRGYSGCIQQQQAARSCLSMQWQFRAC